MSTRAKKAIKRPANKQSRGARRGSQKTVNVVAEKKQTGKDRFATRSVSSAAASAPVHAASAAFPKRKPSRVVAEARGLAQRDAVVSAHPGAASGAKTLEGKTESVIDQNFKVWSAWVRLSPFSLVLHQQAVIARMVLDFMLSSKPDR
jgi:hypothetical protein